MALAPSLVPMGQVEVHATLRRKRLRDWKHNDRSNRGQFAANNVVASVIDWSWSESLDAEAQAAVVRQQINPADKKAVGDSPTLPKHKKWLNPLARHVTNCLTLHFYRDVVRPLSCLWANCSLIYHFGWVFCGLRRACV